MKKFTTIKTLLVGLLALGTTSSWAGEYKATLTHTASSSCGGDASVYTSTVDAAKEHVNNSAFNATWQGAAYAEFAVSIPEGESITSAVLKFKSYGESRRERPCDVMFVNVGESLDYTELSEGKAKVNLAATTIASVNFAKGDGAERDHDIDAKDAVKAIVDAGQTFIIFKFTGNPGGGDIAGMGNEAAAPTLVITTADVSSQTKYTVKFTDGTSDLKDPVEYDGTIGETATASETDLAAIFVGDQKWVYQEGNETITLDGDETTNVITLIFKEAQVFSYTLSSSLGTTIAEGTTFENETVYIPYPEFILNDGTMMKASAIDKQFNYPLTVNADGTTATIEYADAKIEGEIVYFKEAEDIEGFTTTTGGNANIRCSMSAGGYNGGDGDLTITTLEPGKYRIVTQIWGNAGTTFNIVCGSTTLACETKGYIVSYGTEDFTLTEETDVTIPVEGRDGRCFDYIYIIKLPISYNYTVNAIDKDENVLFEIAKGTVYEGQDATVAYPAFYLKGGELLKASPINNGKEYQYTFAVPEDNTIESVIYNSVGINDVVFYKEAEDIEGLTAVSSGNVPIRCSGAKAAFAEADATITSLEAGLYTISGFAWGNAGTDFEVVAGEKTITTFSTVASTMGIVTSPVFELTETTDIVLIANGNGGNSPKVMDYFFIQKVPSNVVINVDEEAGYATYCSEYALDLTGIEAYTATINGTEVTFVEQINNTVAPGTGLLIKAKGDVSIPIAAEGETVKDNALIGVLKNTTVDAGSFVLMYEPYVGFFRASNEFTVGANTAYLAASAAEARIVLPGNEATAIKAIETEQNGEVYNLAGQRVVKAQKGLYIVNGKKVIK